MNPKAKRILLRPIPYLFSDAAGNFIARLWSKQLREELGGTATDKFLDLVLAAFDLAFYLSKDFRKNIRDFQAGYLFRSADNRVASAATFKHGDMQVDPEGAIDDWNVRVTFKDWTALRDFLFFGDQDILDSLLENKVEVDGNPNYIFKFGFMARDLGRRLGVG
jgi:hypothetical protein